MVLKYLKYFRPTIIPITIHPIRTTGSATPNDIAMADACLLVCGVDVSVKIITQYIWKYTL